MSAEDGCHYPHPLSETCEGCVRPMRVLTVQQPWAWAIVHGGKDVENRSQAWGYRGPLAIHAGARWSDRGDHSPLIARAMTERAALEVGAATGQELGDFAKDVITDQLTEVSLARATDFFTPGAVLGVVDLVDVHVSWRSSSRPCCSSPWAEFAEGPTEPVVHLVVEHPRQLEVPIPAKGRLGLWTPDAGLLGQIREQVSA